MATQTGTLKAGNQLVIDSQGASVDYDVSVTGYAVDFKRIQQKNTLSLGPHKVDCTYSVTVNSGSPSIYKVQPNGQREYSPDYTPAASHLAPGESISIPKMGGIPKSNGAAFIGVLYRNNTPVSSANSVASNFQTPVAGFTIPAGAMDKDSTMIIDMSVRVFDTVSATRIVRVFADTQQISAHVFTSTSGLVPMQFRMSNCGDAGAQLQSAGLTINGTEQATVNTRQIDTAGHPVEMTITVETPSGQMIKQALFVELK